jgi:hypothetical protein
MIEVDDGEIASWEESEKKQRTVPWTFAGTEFGVTAEPRYCQDDNTREERVPESGDDGTNSRTRPWLHSIQGRDFCVSGTWDVKRKRLEGRLNNVVCCEERATWRPAANGTR